MVYASVNDGHTQLSKEQMRAPPTRTRGEGDEERLLLERRADLLGHVQVADVGVHHAPRARLLCLYAHMCSVSPVMREDAHGRPGGIDTYIQMHACMPAGGQAGSQSVLFLLSYLAAEEGGEALPAQVQEVAHRLAELRAKQELGPLCVSVSNLCPMCVMSSQVSALPFFVVVPYGEGRRTDRRTHHGEEEVVGDDVNDGAEDDLGDSHHRARAPHHGPHHHDGRLRFCMDMLGSGRACVCVF